MKILTNVLLILLLLLSWFNTYKIQQNKEWVENGVKNIKTIADFVNSKFDLYHPTNK